MKRTLVAAALLVLTGCGGNLAEAACEQWSADFDTVEQAREQAQEAERLAVKAASRSGKYAGLADSLVRFNLLAEDDLPPYEYFLEVSMECAKVEQ